MIEYQTLSGRKYPVDVIVPGFVEAHGALHSGSPTIPGTGISTACFTVESGRTLEDLADDYAVSEVRVLAARCFQAGVDWQRSRSRRKRFEDAMTGLVDVSREPR